MYIYKDVSKLLPYFSEKYPHLYKNQMGGDCIDEVTSDVQALLALAIRQDRERAAGLIEEALPDFVPDIDTDEAGNRNVSIVHRMLVALAHDIRYHED